LASATTSVVVDGGSLTISGALSASGTVVKTGTGMLIISGPQNWSAGSVLQIGGSGGSSPVGGGESAVPAAAEQAGTLLDSTLVAGSAPLAKASESYATDSYAQAAVAASVQIADSGSETFYTVVSTSSSESEGPIAPRGVTSTPAVDAVMEKAVGQQSSDTPITVVPSGGPDSGSKTMLSPALLEWTSAPLTTEPQVQQPVSVAPASSAAVLASSSTAPLAMQAFGGGSAVQTIAAHDAVLAAVAVGQSGSAMNLANELSWLYAYEDMMARKQSSDEDNSPEDSVHAVLAMYWS
jgi:hypothetical protein